MERLTAISENGKAYYPYCFREDTCDGCGSSEKCGQCELSLKVCETLAAYENTGLTPEQIISIATELKERDAAKAPDYEGDGYDNYGNLIYDIWICPNCGKKYEVDYDDYDFCPNCGQRLKWEE